jgi:hypothetical protein
MQETLCMSRTERRRGWLVTKVLAGELTVAEAAPQLVWSERQVSRLVAAMLHSGPAGLVHGNRGRAARGDCPTPIANGSSIWRAASTRALNDCHLAELLAEHEQIVISRQALRSLLRDAGLAAGQERAGSVRARRVVPNVQGWVASRTSISGGRTMSRHSFTGPAATMVPAPSTSSKRQASGKSTWIKKPGAATV